MRPERSFIAERQIAQHCPELLGRPAPSASELMPALARLSGRMAHSFAVGLARLSGGDAPSVRAAAPRATTATQLAEAAPALATYAVFGIGPEAHRVLLTCAADPVFRLIDRAFGGRGTVPDPLPDAFPLSAELLIARLEQTIATALHDALGGADLTVVPLLRETQLAAITPFAADDAVVDLSISVEEEGCAPWTLSLAFPQPTLAALFSERERKDSVPGYLPPDPTREPFASLPITLTAVIVDMALPFARLASLRPGDVLPVAVARTVPLKVGDRTVATGSIGEFEDRVAIQITSAF